MPFKIAIQSPGLHLHTLLADEALQSVLDLVQKHRAAPQPGMGGKGCMPHRGGPGRRHRHEVGSPLPAGATLQRASEPLNDASAQTKARVSSVTLAHIGQLAGGRGFPEKVLLLSAFAESRPSALSVTRLVLRDLFVRLRERPPANFGREMKAVWDLGWVDFPERKEVALTNLGWARVAEILGN